MQQENDQQVKRKRGRPKGSTNKSSTRCVLHGRKKVNLVKPSISLQANQNINRSDHFLNLNLCPNTNPVPSYSVAAQGEQLYNDLQPREPSTLSDTTTELTSQRVLERVDSLSDLVRDLIQQSGDQVKERLDSMEARLFGKRRTESDRTGEEEEVAGSDFEIEPKLKVDELLDDLNYSTWSKSVRTQLNAIKLDIFLHFGPKKENERAIRIDQLVKKAILSTIGPQTVATIDLGSCAYTKQLWSSLRKLFFQDLKNRSASNIAYLTRTDVKTIGEVTAHVELFRKAALELQEIDYGVSENALTEMFLNSFSKGLPTFHEMMRNQVKELEMSYERALVHAVQQSEYFLRMFDEQNASQSDDSQMTLVD